jgi:hypothetical protein
MRSRIATLIMSVAACLQGGATAAQDAPIQPAPTADRQAASPPSSGPAIIVEGRTVELESPAAERSASRSASADSQMFVRCARSIPVDLLRQAIDGPVGRSSTWRALDRIIRMNSGCYSGYFSSPPPPSPYYGDCNPAIIGSPGGIGGSPGGIGATTICRAAYDRSALVEQVLAEHAPDLSLSRADTADPAVQQRFLAREQRRGRNRVSSDRLFTDVATCLVMLRPEQAVALVRSEPGSSAESGLRESMISGARVCVGNARRVTVDPAQFRIYVVDSVYGWIAAARGGESLLPPEEAAS